MHPPPPRLTRVCFLLLLLLLAARVAAKTSLADRAAVKKEVGEKLRAFVARAGRPLQVAGLAEPGPFVRVEDDGRLGGVCIEQIRKLSVDHGFDTEIFEVTGSFDEVVADVGRGSARDKKTGEMRGVDVSVHVFTATGVRSLTARQTASPIDSEFVFLSRKANLLNDLGSAFNAFTIELWGLVFGLLLLLAFNLAIFSYFRSKGDPGAGWVQAGVTATVSAASLEDESLSLGNKLKKFLRMYWDHLYNLGSLLFGQLPFLPSNDTPSRMLYILFKGFAFGLGAFYTALLVTQFQTRHERDLVSMKKFCNEPQAVKDLKDLYVTNGTSYQAYSQNNLLANAADCKQITAEDRRCFDDIDDGGQNLCKSLSECRDRVLAGMAYATLEEETTADWLLSHGWCSKWQKVGRTGSPTATTWVLPLDSDYNELAQTLSNAILLARDDGSFDKITNAAIDKGACKQEELERVGVKNVTGFLVFMGGLWVVAWVVQIGKWGRRFMSGWRDVNSSTVWYKGASGGEEEVFGGSTESSGGIGAQQMPAVESENVSPVGIRLAGSLDGAGAALVIPLTMLPFQGRNLWYARPSPGSTQS